METQYYLVKVIIIVLFYMGIRKQGIVGYSFTYSISTSCCLCSHYSYYSQPPKYQPMDYTYQNYNPASKL